MNLYVLTPHSQQIPAQIAGRAASGDWILDLGRFPPVAYQVRADQTCRDETDHLVGPRDYWTIARDWLTEFTARTGLQDVLSINGYGFWWTHVGQRFVAGLTELGNSFAWIDLLHAIRAESLPGRVLIYGRHAAILHLVHVVCGGTEVEIQAEEPTEHRQQARIPRHAGLMVVRFLLSLVYLLYSLIRRPQILLLSNTNLMRETGIGPQRRLRDVYLGEVESALRGRGWRVTVAEMCGWNASWPGLAARGFFFPSELVVLLSSLTWNKIGLHRDRVRKWRKRWAKVQPTLAPHLRYRGYDIAPLVGPLVTREFTQHAPRLEVMVRIWQALLRLWRPRLLYLHNAYGERQMTAIIAAKCLGIPTVEQQHGLIGRNHIAYLVPRHLKLDTAFPLCDRMLVWGDYTRSLLIGAGVYEPEEMPVVGFPRADMLLRALPPHAATRAQLDIPADWPVVLYTSNGFASDYMYELLTGIQQASDANIYWLIKLHPREKTRHRWEEAVKARRLRAVRVLEGEYDFYSVLNICNLHISFASTTLIEAAILGKLNLGLDVPHISDPAGYAEANAFVPVPPSELGSAVQHLMADAVQRTQLLAIQKAFAENWCLHDGKSVERIVAALEAVAT